VFKIANQAEYDAGVAAWLAGAEALAVQTYRGLAAYAFTYIMEETPEYTGESVSNWTLNAGAPLAQYQSGIKEEYRAAKHTRDSAHTKFWAGNPNMQALQIAEANRDTGLATITSLDEKVYIVNATTFDGIGGRTVADLEDPPGGWLRAVNEPGHMIGRAVDYIGQNFADLNAAALASLMRSTI
jgi:hypothetical protein